MPIYEYVCKDCEKSFEILVRASTKVECPSCHGARLEKQLSLFGAKVNTAFGAAKSIPEETMACGACGDPGGPGACSMDD